MKTYRMQYPTQQLISFKPVKI